MSRVSRMSSVGAKSIKSSMGTSANGKPLRLRVRLWCLRGVSMFSRDQSGFDLLHQWMPQTSLAALRCHGLQFLQLVRPCRSCWLRLAGKSDAVASSFQFQESGAQTPEP